MNISIIVPIHFYEPRINLLVKSLCEQTNSNFEVIFVANKVNHQEYIRIRNIIEPLFLNYHIETVFLYTKLLGANPSRKIGLEHSKYDYVYFMDCDDALAHKEVIDELVSIVKKHSPDVISTNIQKATLKDNALLLNDIIYKYKKSNTFLINKNDNYAVTRNYGSNIVARLFKKTCLMKIDFANVPFFQDWNISSKIYPNLTSFFFLQKPTYLYIKNAKSISQFHNMKEEDWLNAFYCIEDIYAYFKSNNLEDRFNKFIYYKVLYFCFAYLHRSRYFDIDQGRKKCQDFLLKNNFHFQYWFLKDLKLMAIYFGIKKHWFYSVINKY